MWWPAWLSIGTPLKFWLWLGNRLATGAGVLSFWRRHRARRIVWVWVVLINVVSLAGLGVVFFWLSQTTVR